MIAWEESGAGRPAVFVHGITEDRHVWDGVIPLFEGDFRCVRLDLRGHGASPGADDLSALAMADDIGTVVREAGIDEPPLLIGHSLGGFVSTAYATQAPTSAVVNVDQPLRVGDFARALQPLADQLRGPDWRATVRVVIESLGVEQLNAADRKYVFDMVEAVPHEVILGVWGLVLDSSPDDLDALVESMLPAIKSPYLALHGSDPGDGYEQWLTKLVPNATFEVWDGVGHFVQLVEPERFASRVKEFASSSGI
jgi:pimeloyl-ACP methyl ester carboxylesterase